MVTTSTVQAAEPQAWPKRRMHHLFAADGRAVMVAMDHARLGNTAGLQRPRETVARVVAGGADAILTTPGMARAIARSEEHTSELQSRRDLVCRLLLEKKKKKKKKDDIE